MVESEIRKEMQERGLLILSKNKGGFQFTNTFFPYTSGEIGPYYVQSGVVQNCGSDYVSATAGMISLVKSSVPEEVLKNAVISGGETRDWIFSNAVALAFHLPHVMLYKDGKTVGANMKGKEVIHIADLNNEGSSPKRDWVPIIKKNDGTIKDIFFYVDRMEEGVNVMQELGLRGESVVPLDAHAWDYLQQIKVVTPEVYEQLRARGTTKEERRVWATNMLRTDAGLETLACLLSSARTREKGQKIVNIGYPEMKDELVDRLRTKFGRGVAESAQPEGFIL